MIIAIRSYNRSDRVVTRKLFPGSIIFTGESQLELYRERCGGDVEAYPDSLLGNTAAFSNFIMDWAFDRDEEFLLLDDDIKELVVFELDGPYAMDREYAMAVIQDGFRMCRELGARMWGINVASDPRFYHAWKPFGLHTPVLGPFAGFLRNPLRYDERLPHKEDYDMFLQQLRKYRKVLRFDKYCYQCDHISPGGLATYRTHDSEREQNLLLQKKWGSHIVRLDKRGRDINPILRSPI